MKTNSIFWQFLRSVQERLTPGNGSTVTPSKHEAYWATPIKLSFTN